MADVRRNEERSRFELGDAVLTYVLGEGEVVLEHTVVPPEMGGQGVGGRLADAALAWARDEGLAVVPVCPFVQAHLAKHPEAGEGVELREA